MPMLLTNRELAVAVGLSPRTIDRYRRLGRLPHVRVNRQVVRYELDAVLDALRRGEGKKSQ
jgi:hypothetical protein